MMQASDDLERCLDRLHAALMAGDLSQIAGLGAEVDHHLQDLHNFRDRAQADRLRAKATRNATCLQAAARGVRAARRRLTEIHAAQVGLATYDGQGKRQDLPLNGGRLAQRY